MNKPQTCAIITTCPDQSSARTIADALIQENLAACVNIISGVTSVYHWQGKIEQSQEQLLFIKTLQQHYALVEQCILKLHPYELPEVIAVPINDGSAAYLSWISEQVM